MSWYSGTTSRRQSNCNTTSQLCRMSTGLDQWKTFSENYEPSDYDFGLCTELSRMIVVCNFSLSSFKLREGIQPALTKFLNKFSKWKTTCYIKPNFSCGIFLFLLAKYLISVAIALTHFKQGCIKPGITTDNFSIVRILNFHSKPDVRMKTMPYTLFVLHLEWQELSKSGNSTLMLFFSRTALKLYHVFGRN